MNRRIKFVSSILSSLMLVAGLALADDDGYCMDVNISGFHMMPGSEDSAGSCAVRDFWGGELQAAFYPFTKEDHLFNCDYFEGVDPYYGAAVTLPNGAVVPSSVVSQDQIIGTIGGHPFSAKLYCASQTNWYQDSCLDPNDPTTCKFQLRQPFLTPPDEPFYARVSEVSVFDGVITVEKRNKTVEVPLVLATRAAGLMHVEDLAAPQVGASITHSALGMVTYDDDGDEARVLDGSLDLLLQGHIFHPGSVQDDDKPAVIKGAICSEALYKLLNKTGGGGKGKKDD
ncbi:MAG: hypothetical protein QNJ78_12790 [Gammaproteobacteria bacterium]|nr:hypothetical protein [Gammaproteobacteria bacterium]